MGKLFRVNDNLFYVKNPYAEKNVFLKTTPESVPLPDYQDFIRQLPVPVWDGHDDAIACYNKTWNIAFKNLKRANGEAGFVSNYIDTAFNGYLFMWDSSFITMFGRYGSRGFDFQKTLDNFYSHQHKDGFICREICESAPGEQFTRDDPASTGPNIMPWSEWEYFCSTGDIERLGKVFDPLCAYHKWLQLNRSWPDGGYFSCGLACGMDNQPRQPEGYEDHSSHGHMTWIDTCAQQLLSAKILIKMADRLGRTNEVGWLESEAGMLYDIINRKMWDGKTGFYYDVFRDGSVSGIKTIGAYWTLVAGAVPEKNLASFVSHLENETEFRRPHRIPSLSADNANYRENGGYWRGGVWAPTNYMVLKGLEMYGFHRLAYEIAFNNLDNVVKVFNDTGTLWENYAPEAAVPGKPARRDFVGWTGLVPIAMLFEYVFGIHPDAMKNHIEWHINRTEKHGVRRYPLGSGTLDLICEARRSDKEPPKVSVISDIPVTVDIAWDGGKETIVSGK